MNHLQEKFTSCARHPLSIVVLPATIYTAPAVDSKDLLMTGGTEVTFIIFSDQEKVDQVDGTKPTNMQGNLLVMTFYIVASQCPS